VWVSCKPLTTYPSTPAYSPPPDAYNPPAAPQCYLAGQSYREGQTGKRSDGYTCVCRNGAWTSCEQPPPNKCWANGQSYGHGQSGKRNDGKECVCNNGVWQNCKDQNCWADGRSYTAGQTAMRNGQQCTCRPYQGGWTDCQEQRCWYNGKSYTNGQWIPKGSTSCQCYNGKHVNCKEECRAGKAQLMFLFDTSVSITENSSSEKEDSVGRKNWRAMINFAAEAINQLPVSAQETRIGISSFSDDPETILGFNDFASSNKQAALNTLINFTPRLKGQTYLGEALRHVDSEYTAGRDTSRILVILTDGNADDNIRDISASMRRQGTIIFAVGVGNIEEDQLLTLTGGNRNRVLYVESFDQLADEIDWLTAGVCQDYTAFTAQVYDSGAMGSKFGR